MTLRKCIHPTTEARRSRYGRRLAAAALGALAVAAFVGIVVAGCGSSETVELFPVQLDGKWGYIDGSGRVVIEPEFDRVGRFSEGLAPVSSGGEMGYVDLNGEFQIEPQFANAGDFDGGPAPVTKGMNPQVGFVGRDGTMVVDFQYDDVAGFDEGLAPVKSEGKWGFIDQTGEVAIPCSFDDVGSFTDGLARAKTGDMWGYIDHSGEWVIQPTYDGTEADPPVMHFSEGLAAALVGSRWVYIDHAGNTVIDGDFLAAGEFSEGLAPVIVSVEGKSGGYQGFIDKNGTMVIAPTFVGSAQTVNDSRLAGFHDGLAAVQPSDGKLVGYIDTEGNWVIEPQFSNAYNFIWGSLALVTLEDGRGGWINREGEVVFEQPAAEGS